MDGVDSRALGANLSMLQASFTSHNFTFHQYQNVFQFLANSVTELSATSVLSHEQILHAVLVNDPRQCEARGMSRGRRGRDGAARGAGSALGMQDAGPLRGRRPAAHQRAQRAPRQPGPHAHDELRPGAARVVHPRHPSGTDDQITLGFKGYGLKQMAAYGHKVPQGFVLSTELFGAMPAMSYPPLYDDTINRVRRPWRCSNGRPGCASVIARRTLLLSDPLGRGHLHARPHDDVRQCGPQRRARGGLRGQPGLRLGRLGQLPPLPAVVGHVGRHRTATSSTPS